jgi:hypothetical protein
MLEREEYFEAHEVLEVCWHPLRRHRDPLANLLKGLINAAVAFEHLKRDRKGADERARRVMTSFERYRPLCTEGIREAELFSEACWEVDRIKASHREVFDVLVP